MPTVLTSPAAGYQRFDNTNSNISYFGTGWETWNVSYFYCSSMQQSSAANANIKFNFTGSLLRLIGSLYTNKSTSNDLYIDGQKVLTFSQYYASQLDQVMCFDVTWLSSGEHYCQIINNNAAYFSVDAIDIASTGTLKPYSVIDTVKPQAMTGGM